MEPGPIIGLTPTTGTIDGAPHIQTPSWAEHGPGGRFFRVGRSLAVCLLSVISVVLVSLAIAAPILEFLRVRAAESFYHFLSLICHQIPSRSAFIMGSNTGLCYRCLALYGAIGVGIALPLSKVVKRVGRTIRSDIHGVTLRRLTVVIAGLFILMLFLDGFLPIVGWPPSTNPRRIITGLLGGWAIISLLSGTPEE
jgi:uncharacterized membrane protein